MLLVLGETEKGERRNELGSRQKGKLCKFYTGVSVQGGDEVGMEGEMDSKK